MFWCRVDLWVFQISRRSALLSTQLSLLLSPAMAYQALQLGEVTVNAKGAKLALLTSGGERFHYTTPSPLRAPFGGPSNFDKDKDAPRQNLELRCSDEAVAAFFKGLDEWAVEYICAHSQRLFKKNLSLQQVKEMYHPCLRQAVGYDPLLRTKINMPGARGECRYWTADQTPRGPPLDWKECELSAHLHISHLWLMGASCGLVCNCTDLLVSEASRAFPFAVQHVEEE